MTKSDNLQAEKDFMVWWDNEGSRAQTKEEMHLMDREEFLFQRCKDAWLNGAYKALEKKNDQNRKR